MSDNPDTKAVLEREAVGNAAAYAYDPTKTRKSELPDGSAYALEAFKADKAKEPTTVGNAAAMREALERIAIRSAASRDFDPVAEIDYIHDIAESALAAPPRNCDRFDDLNSAQRHYIEHGCPKGLGMLVDGEIRKAPWKSQFEKWLFAPAKGKEGETDGSK